jgi:hypothetical protein
MCPAPCPCQCCLLPQAGRQAGRQAAPADATRLLGAAAQQATRHPRRPTPQRPTPPPTRRPTPPPTRRPAVSSAAPLNWTPQPARLCVLAALPARLLPCPGRGRPCAPLTKTSCPASTHRARAPSACLPAYRARPTRRAQHACLPLPARQRPPPPPPCPLPPQRTHPRATPPRPTWCTACTQAATTGTTGAGASTRSISTRAALAGGSSGSEAVVEQKRQ